MITFTEEECFFYVLAGDTNSGTWCKAFVEALVEAYPKLSITSVNSDSTSTYDATLSLDGRYTFRMYNSTTTFYINVQGVTCNVINMFQGASYTAERKYWLKVRYNSDGWLGLMVTYLGNRSVSGGAVSQPTYDVSTGVFFIPFVIPTEDGDVDFYMTSVRACKIGTGYLTYTGYYPLTCYFGSPYFVKADFSESYITATYSDHTSMVDKYNYGHEAWAVQQDISLAGYDTSGYYVRGGGKLYNLSFGYGAIPTDVIMTDTEVTIGGARFMPIAILGINGPQSWVRLDG